MVDTDERVEFFPPRQHVGISRHALGSPPGKDKNNCGGTGSRANVQKKMYVAARTRARTADAFDLKKGERAFKTKIWKIVEIIYQ